MKKILLILMLTFFPSICLAYSNEILLGGSTLGIEMNFDGILIVGFYEVNGHFNKGDNPLKIGDYITSINGKKVNTLKELTEEIEKYTSDEKVEVTFMRDKKEMKTTLPLVKSEGIYKTGLYVKDNIMGIGTLTYIDPNTKIYGALGHEVIESNTKEMVEVKSGLIFRNSILNIEKSKIGVAGSKNAKYFYNTIYGNILKNTNHGIFGIYESTLPDLPLISVGSAKDIKVGDAKIYTVLNKEKVEEFTINILSLNENADTKNIVFEITDQNLINKTGGVVQGMSGSPIVQDNKIVGVVTHVIVDNPVTGYGLFITKMLEEGEKGQN